MPIAVRASDFPPASPERRPGISDVAGFARQTLSEWLRSLTRQPDASQPRSRDAHTAATITSPMVPVPRLDIPLHRQDAATGWPRAFRGGHPTPYRHGPHRTPFPAPEVLPSTSQTNDHCPALETEKADAGPPLAPLTHHHKAWPRTRRLGRRRRPPPHRQLSLVPPHAHLSTVLNVHARWMSPALWRHKPLSDHETDSTGAVGRGGAERLGMRAVAYG